MEKWQAELYSTPLWLLQTFIGVVIVCALLIFALRRTIFGRQFWRVLQPCLSRANIAKIVMMVAFLLLLLLLEVRFSVLNTFFYNGLYSALQDKNLNAFWFFASLNALLLGVRIVNEIIDEWLGQVLQIRWLERLNHALTERWLANKNYYRLQMRRQRPDNIDQRIQQDAQDFIATTVEFVRGMINSVVSAIEFSIVLWGLSGVLALFGFEIPRGMVFFVFIFVILATFVAMWIGKPLIKLNFNNERLNGNYRYSLIRVRDHAESIAFYDGEKVERQNLRTHFRRIIDNRWRIVYRSLGLNGFNSGITQGVQLLPLMLQAPRFFAGQVTIGDMHQTVQAFNRLQRALSFFRNFYEQFTAYQARLERLSGFMENLTEYPAFKQPQVSEVSDGLVLNDVALYRNNGEVLLEHINIDAQRGDALLIQGPSGCGKTSLLRALAGLWPFGSSGCIQRPAHEHILFVPQRPYVPQGSLREAVCYPDISSRHPDLIGALLDCRLGHLVDKLDEHDDWQQRLSPGELQRIAFVRILLTQAQVVLLDEATSALDEPTEAALYQLIKTRLPQSIIVSIGHRNTLAAFHNRSLQVSPAACG